MSYGDKWTAEQDQLLLMSLTDATNEPSYYRRCALICRAFDREPKRDPTDIQFSSDQEYLLNCENIIQRRLWAVLIDYQQATRYQPEKEYIDFGRESQPLSFMECRFLLRYHRSKKSKPEPESLLPRMAYVLRRRTTDRLAEYLEGLQNGALGFGLLMKPLTIKRQSLFSSEHVIETLEAEVARLSAIVAGVSELVES